MKFTLRRASRCYGKGREVEINTIEELVELVNKEECSIIVEYHWGSKDINTLMVYDDYLE